LEACSLFFFGMRLTSHLRATALSPPSLLKPWRKIMWTNGWLPIDETSADGLVILTPDPERN
jgi:hypothetical protein